MALSVSFFEPLVGGDQKVFLVRLSPVAPPVQALIGLPCLGSFSVAPCVRHIEGTPWLGSYSVDLYIRHLKGHPG